MHETGTNIPQNWTVWYVQLDICHGLLDRSLHPSLAVTTERFRAFVCPGRGPINFSATRPIANSETTRWISTRTWILTRNLSIAKHGGGYWSGKDKKFTANWLIS